ncbi:MAG: discoidin domain-containing protein [Chloroflexi bacterium]|nr:discoidin domain-containing protein [Chloroflexota bacterium]
MNTSRCRIATLVATLCLLPALSVAGTGRSVISLDGPWDIAEETMQQPPRRFENRVPVPGLVDMARPAFAGVGETNKLREAFWYRKTFQIKEAVPAVARLKIHKAAYGTRVWLNGTLAGEHLPSFTPGYFDLRPALRGAGATNELLVRVGATRDSVPPNVPTGWDFEKMRYIPGIYDSVELILSGTPHLVRVQTAPDITNQTVRVQAVARNVGGKSTIRLNFTVREARSRKVVGAASSEPITLDRGAEKTVDVLIPIKNCRRWSPEAPFLYELETGTGADTRRDRFGMREFHFDQPSGRAYLNGKPRFLRGSNVTLYRFFEDPARGDRPWREEWVRRLHRRFKTMNWHALRYCIGFPPELWYRIADEEGFLIQDEYPLWHLSGKRLRETWPAQLTSDQLAMEYTEWMQERWNHPSVVIWDAQNETVTTETGRAIQRVRGLDLSHRPWDNGWAPAQAPGDCFESHPYLFQNPNFKLSDVAYVPGVPRGNVIPNSGTNAIVINEYGWLWLNRDGTPTTLTRDVYKNLLGEKATVAERRHLYARYLAAKTEFWRAHRACAGVLHFCGLGYSRSDGQTSDHFTDIEKLTYEPEFERYVKDAFAPVGLMIDEWAEDLPAAVARAFPVVVVNDLDNDWKGGVRFRVRQGAKVIAEKDRLCDVPALGVSRLTFNMPVPLEPGHYQLEATLERPGERPVRSLRDFEVLTAAQKKARDGLAVGRPVIASSSATKDGISYPAENAVDGQRRTRWSSEFSDPQWLAVDLGAVREISRVELLWESAYAKAYAIQTSLDGETWNDVFATDQGDGQSDDIRFVATRARWVRFYGTKRATEFGYSLWEMRVSGI